MNTKTHSLNRLRLFLAGLAAPALVLSTSAGLAAEAPPQDKPLELRVISNQGKLVRGVEQDVVLKIDLVAGKPKKGGVRLPLNVAVVLDRSGSMAGDKLDQAKQAATMLVDRLEPEDVFSLVTYESGVEVEIPAAKVGENADKFQRKIKGIESGGSTALYAGVEEGTKQIREYLKSNRINRVLLLSDGLANVGPKSPREITKLGKQLAEDGIGVTTIGLGEGFNEDLMTSLAEASDANYYFVEDVEKLSDVFAKELGQLGNIVARDVQIRITLPEGIEPVEIMGRSEKFSGQSATVRLSQFNASQKREILVKARLTPREKSADQELASISTTYRDELAEGNETTLQASARAELTDSDKVAVESRNAEVIVRVQEMETDKAKQDAADLAVAGKAKEAEILIKDQISRNIAAAPRDSVFSAAILQENRSLEEYNADFQRQEGDDLSVTAKRAKSESWNRRQSKN